MIKMHQVIRADWICCHIDLRPAAIQQELTAAKWSEYSQLTTSGPGAAGWQASLLQNKSLFMQRHTCPVCVLDVPR